MKTKDEVLRAFNALRLEVDNRIVDDIAARFKSYSDEVEGKLLEATQNLGHPAYGLSSSVTIGIDNLREKLFDYLDVPKS